ncbi:transcription factor [Trichoderma arundinaceum]|uniref:Transcription factor n=1 Tax=Trichoderma arundinaceum TaxID=490622 RepID=A0A395NU58_TRIAR|nr:transcription factor [Trichoderma arundinaceum]
MSIHEDARKGILVGDVLGNYIKNNQNILNEQSPDLGLTPLAIAVVEGFPEEVEQLLEKGAEADGRSKNDETPLLLAAWKTKRERALIIQLLLKKVTLETVDHTCKVAGFKTPLMYAVENKDLESIRLLRKAKASVDIKSEEGFTARDIAKYAGNPAVSLALDLDEEKAAIGTLASKVVDLLLYIVEWVNKTVKGALFMIPKSNPQVNDNIDQIINEGEDPTKEEFVENVGQYLENRQLLERFFKGKKDFIQKLTQKIASLEQDPTTDFGNKDLLQKRVKVSLYQQVIYCDDSTSMKREGRWESQKELIQRITQVTTLILPDGEGVALRFINRDVNNSTNLTLEGIRDLLQPMTWQPGGDTPIGTNLRSKILQPIVYSKIEDKTLERPLLIIIITDGMPEPEDSSVLVNAILECERKLQENNYPPENFLRNNQDIARTTFVTSEKLDEKFAEYKSNEKSVDQWLIETLFSPFQNY